jgi:hypothetical protein
MWEETIQNNLVRNLNTAQLKRVIHFVEFSDLDLATTNVFYSKSGREEFIEAHATPEFSVVGSLVAMMYEVTIARDGKIRAACSCEGANEAANICPSDAAMRKHYDV